MPRPIKVLQIAKHFHPDTGGIETVTRSISDMLISHSIQADVLCTAMRDDSYPTHIADYRVLRCKPGLRIGGNKSISLDYIRNIGRLNGDYDVALVHMPNPIAAAAVVGFWRKPAILLWHADIPQPLIRNATVWLDKALAHKSAAVIGPTLAHLDQSHRADSIVHKGVVIPLPHQPNRLPPPTGRSAAANRVNEFLNGRSLSLSIGRLVGYKGFDVLIDAASALDPTLAIAIVGQGPLEAELRARIIENGVSDRVLMMGGVSDQELADLMDIAHFGCMPSIDAAEMYGMAQVEMFSAGKPVIATRIPRSGVSLVNRDGETGLIVTPGDSNELAAAMNRLIQDPELHRRLSDGARLYTQQTSLDVVAEQYAQLIRSVAVGQLAHKA